MQEAGLLPTRHQRLPCRLDPPGLDLPRAYGWYPGGYSGRAGEGTEASGPASELPARNTPIRGSRTIELFFFFPTETASCSRQKPPVGRSRREISLPSPAAPLCWGCHFLLRTPPTPEIPRVFLLAPKARDLRERIRVSGGQLAPSQSLFLSTKGLASWMSPSPGPSEMGPDRDS